jgi:hypothetical protein
MIGKATTNGTANTALQPRKAARGLPRLSSALGGASYGRLKRGRSEVVVLVREVVRVTAVRPARPTKGAKKQRAKPPISLFLPREMRLPSLVVAADATAAAFWA